MRKKVSEAVLVNAAIKRLKAKRIKQTVDMTDGGPVVEIDVDDEDGMIQRNEECEEE